MRAWCKKCKGIRLFYYKWMEQVYVCEECGHEEKFPDRKPPPD
jgi:uncharacterized protein (DUF983 family)